VFYPEFLQLAALQTETILETQNRNSHLGVKFKAINFCHLFPNSFIL